MNDVHSARIDAKGLRPDEIDIVEANAEAIAVATGAETELFATTEGTDE